MTAYSLPVERLIDELSRLPGIGRKSAERLVFHLLREPKSRVQSLSDALLELKEKIHFCNKCFNYTDSECCNICSNSSRDCSTLCVVEMPKDLSAIERTSGYRGLYHVLHGAISPISGVMPEDLKIPELLKRLDSEPIKEVILATNPSVEGDATAFYLIEKIKERGIKLSRIAHGVPVGADLDFFDSMTIQMALKNRVEL